MTSAPSWLSKKAAWNIFTVKRQTLVNLLLLLLPLLEDHNLAVGIFLDNSVAGEVVAHVEGVGVEVVTGADRQFMVPLVRSMAPIMRVTQVLFYVILTFYILILVPLPCLVLICLLQALHQPSANGILGSVPSPIMCQICFSPGHSAASCPSRFVRSNAPALIVPSGETNDALWYPDSGASAHMTPAAGAILGAPTSTPKGAKQQSRFREYQTTYFGNHTCKEDPYYAPNRLQPEEEENEHSSSYKYYHKEDESLTVSGSDESSLLPEEMIQFNSQGANNNVNNIESHSCFENLDNILSKKI
ncbi:unnamed protein product [Cuscuta epithymum]|uniref:CCHC-type domain-containing protein n=1 Tax=Cuscuta epithymum TaxID=186058 RepID=A0AAV0EE63_9ASTE|nr:unnamed protein product [Cuscuta epithymum]